jgi:TonB family protein
MEAVTAVLLDRERAARGLRPMVACSIVLHVTAVVAMVLGPGRWLTGAVASSPKVVMNVSLGSGRGGPANGGANPLGGRPVQRVVTGPAARPEPARTPAARTPEMTVPDRSPKSRPATRETEPWPSVKSAPEGAHGRVPIAGPEEKFGSSFADTGVTGLGMGLATGGTGTGGSLDVGDFCCPDYLQVMARRITEQWNSRQGVSGMTVMRFTIQRDGRITDIGTEQSGGYVLDLAAQRALLAVGRLPQLPPAFTHPSLTVYLRFEYKR